MPCRLPLGEVIRRHALRVIRQAAAKARKVNDDGSPREAAR